MKTLLVSINSKFIHSNLAVRYLKAYTKDLEYDCTIREFSINDKIERVLEEIVKENADLVGFSVYIWNVQFVKAVSTLLKLVSPRTIILFGGPEVSYDSEYFLKNSCGDYLICGEGEETYREFIEYKLASEEKVNIALPKIKGLYIKNHGKIDFFGIRELMNINSVVFPYSIEDELLNKIVYYEASRGCPFNCIYCLSSTVHGVRFRNTNKVKEELDFLIKKGVKLIKFVDRTFNCSETFASEIWEYLINVDTDAVFHFEISGDILTENELQLLSKAPKGRFQFEVGVQTTNDKILKNINRHVNFVDIKEKVLELEKIKNIKQHLDLIAGLPGEDYSSFKKSFNDVYNIQPEEIQLGFLKLLKGSSMREEAATWGMVYSPYPPYEILLTDKISYDEIQKLKRVEEVLDKYYNSQKFSTILKYFIRKFNSPFDFYYELGTFFENHGYFSRSISSTDYYKAFLEFNKYFFNEDSLELSEIIKFDYLMYNKKKYLPSFLKREINKNVENFIKLKVKNEELKLSPKYHVEKFFIDIEAYLKKDQTIKGDFYIVFDEENLIYFQFKNYV
jgi:radical SAM superfamily enzyme YgiQ (UPF0313 family)